MSVTQQQPIQAVKVDEQILVVKRSHLFPQGAWQGMYAGEPEKYEQLVRQHHEFFSSIIDGTRSNLQADYPLSRFYP